MRKSYRIHIILLASLLAVLVSCNGTGGRWFPFGNADEAANAQHTLAFADSIMETYPDTAYALLHRDSAIISRTGKAERMLYAMLNTQAKDKLYIPHTSDSLMQEVAKYYDKHGTPRQQAQAYYLLGRVCYDCNLYGSALSAFKQTLALPHNKDSVVAANKMRASTWTAVIYENNEQHKKALYYRKLSYKYAVTLGSTKAIIYTLRDIGRSNARLRQYKHAVTYYRKAAELAKSINDAYLYNMVSEELAYVYINMGMMREAYKSLSTPIVWGVEQDAASRYSIWALYYDKIGMPDSAILLYGKALEHSSIEAKTDIYRSMMGINKKRGKFPQAFVDASMAITMSDSLQKLQTKEFKDFIERIEERNKLQRHNEELTKEKDSLVLFIVLSIFAAIVISLCGYIYYSRRKRIQKEKNERIRRYWEKRHNEDVNNIRQNEKHIQELEDRLLASSEKLDDMERKILETKAALLKNDNERLRTKQKEKSLLEMEIRQSEIYQKFHSPTFKPSSNDFILLEESLNKAYYNFVIRLKELCPTIRIQELQLCCLMKIGLSSKDISRILLCQPSTLSMMKKRLFFKLSDKEGGANDLHDLICNL